MWGRGDRRTSLRPAADPPPPGAAGNFGDSKPGKPCGCKRNAIAKWGHFGDTMGTNCPKQHLTRLDSKPKKPYLTSLTELRKLYRRGVKGLKIPRVVSPVPVQVRSPAPFKLLITQSIQVDKKKRESAGKRALLINQPGSSRAVLFPGI